MPTPQEFQKIVKAKSMPISLLPLENGDRLTRHEFEQRYQAAALLP